MTSQVVRSRNPKFRFPGLILSAQAVESGQKAPGEVIQSTENSPSSRLQFWLSYHTNIQSMRCKRNLLRAYITGRACRNVQWHDGKGRRKRKRKSRGHKEIERRRCIRRQQNIPAQANRDRQKDTERKRNGIIETEVMGGKGSLRHGRRTRPVPLHDNTLPLPFFLRRLWRSN